MSAARPLSSSSEAPLDCIIVGTGFSGLGMAVSLHEAGRKNFVILEKANDVGGTWRENDYPGCACDVPSHLYSFSFAPNPEWTRMYAPQGEILNYLRGCAERYGLREKIRFGQELREARFDEARGEWTVTTGLGDTFRARHLVLGTGALHLPATPKLPGIETFAGETFHSAQWRHDVKLEGKNVVVLGTGASSIQFVPKVAPTAKSLTLVQRTPPWILPKPDRKLTGFERTLARVFPLYQRAYRWFLYWLHESRALGFTVHPSIMKLAARLARRHIHKQIADPALRTKVTPTYLPGCKRILISDDYYPALARKNVNVVTGEIREVREHGVVDSQGVFHEADVLIYGTGFRVTEPLSRMRIVGLGGKDLETKWRDEGMSAYRGTTISGFPNLYFLMGPNTGLGHNSMVFMIESQIGYARDQMQALDARRAAFADVKPEAQRGWNLALRPRLKRAVWNSGCHSWYLDKNGDNPTLWPGFTFEFWSKLRRLNTDDLVFSGSTLAAESDAPTATVEPALSPRAVG